MAGSFGHRSKPVFGRRARNENEADHAPDSPMPVIVPRSDAGSEPDAYGDFYLVEAVSRFVGKLVEHGCYTWSEVPARAVQAHCILDYLGQVENGGHSQFVANRGGASDYGADRLAGAPQVVTPLALEDGLDLAAKGMAAAGAGDHLAILRDCQRWLADNPERAARQTGFQGGRAAGLQMIDQRFRAFERTDPIAPRLVAWIASWPELRIVEDAEYQEAIRRLIANNPHREARLVAHAVAGIERNMVGEGIEGEQGRDAAAAIDLLLRKAGLNPASCGLSRDRQVSDRSPDECGWVVMADFRSFSALTGDKGAVLVSVDDVGESWTATRGEIEAHRDAFRAAANGLKDSS